MITAHYLADAHDSLALAGTVQRILNHDPQTRLAFYQNTTEDAIGILQYPEDESLTPDTIEAAWRTAAPPEVPASQFADWVKQWSPLTPPDAPTKHALECPVCQTPQSLIKRMNADWDEIWTCTTCPAVLFLYSTPSQIQTLSALLDPPIIMPI